MPLIDKPKTFLFWCTCLISAFNIEKFLTVLFQQSWKFHLELSGLNTPVFVGTATMATCLCGWPQGWKLTRLFIAHRVIVSRTSHYCMPRRLYALAANVFLTGTVLILMVNTLHEDLDEFLCFPSVKYRVKTVHLHLIFKEEFLFFSIEVALVLNSRRFF